VTESPGDVLREFDQFLCDAIAAFSFARLGLRSVAETTAALPAMAQNPDPMHYIGVGDPTSPESFWAWRRSELLWQVAPDGPAETYLSQQWIAYAYDGWQEVYRPRLAAAHGCAKADLRYPVLGDLRHLRNDVVHHRGVATTHNTGRCSVLSHWFKAGDVIRLRDEHFVEFRSLLPWDRMATAPRRSGGARDGQR
jgi:hypothetical protein